MLPLYDMLANAQNGQGMEMLARQFNLTQEQTREAVAALLPAFSQGLKRNASDPWGVAAFMNAMASGQHAKYFEDEPSEFSKMLASWSGAEEETAALPRGWFGIAAMKRQLTEAASTIMGSGWGALVWEPLAGKLLTTQIYDHQSNIAQGGVPILVLDAWEHAYYLQYQNRKTDFFDAVWNLWNWKDVAERYDAVRSLDVAIANAAG